MSADLREMRARLAMSVSRGTVSAVDDATQAQALQVELLADEAHDSIERFQNYGFTSVPHPDAEAVAVAVGGVRSHLIVVAVEDRRYRLKSLKSGEVAMYDDQGQYILLGRDGISIRTDKPLTVNAQDANVTAERVLIDSADISLGGTGGQPVARVGDDVVNGKITSGSGKVKAA